VLVGQPVEVRVFSTAPFIRMANGLHDEFSRWHSLCFDKTGVMGFVPPWNVSIGEPLRRSAKRTEKAGTRSSN
jgi:hypothetical protein